jgi:uncharacterized protein
MKTSLKHLPEFKQKELKTIVQVIQENSSAKKLGMIILFGSHARGDWVEDRYVGEDGILYEYKSDFDLLIVTTTYDAAQKHAKWRRTEDYLRNHPELRTLVSLIVIDIRTLNNELQRGRFFYRDIQKEGIILFDAQFFKLEKAKELPPEMRWEEAQIHFDKWFESANEFLIDFQNALDRDSRNNAAFHLHQATERLFITTLLVYTNYKPKSHDLKKLYPQVISQDPAFITIFPQNTEWEKENFILLKKAYIDSRYNMDEFHITQDQLEWLAERVTQLKELTEKSCREKIKELKAKIIP